MRLLTTTGRVYEFRGALTVERVMSEKSAHAQAARRNLELHDCPVFNAIPALALVEALFVEGVAARTQG